MHTACAADSTKVKRVKATQTEVAKAETEKGKTPKAEKPKSEKSKAAKADSAKVVTPPAPPAPLFTDIIPQPLSVVKGEGRFTINEQTAIICGKGLESAASYLTQYVPLTRTSGKKSNSIRLILDEKLAKEEYSLVISKSGIELLCGEDL